MASARTLIMCLCAVTMACGDTAEAQPAVAARAVVSPDRPDGVYAARETVKWTAEWIGPGEPPAGVTYTIKRGGRTVVGQGTLNFVGGKAGFESTFNGPDTALATVRWGDGPAGQAVGGAVAEPFAIRPASPEEPADFDAFWVANLDALKKIPPNAVTTSGSLDKPGVRYEKVTLDHIGGTRVHGQVARPATGDKFPAILIPQWAGVYALQKPWVTGLVSAGWLAMNVQAHDIPIDSPPEYYAKLNAPGGALQNYWKIGNTDRQTSYYLRMYLSVCQSIAYLKTRPDWDGKTIVLMGASQGGQQTLAAAGLCAESVTAAIAFLPAGCDTWAENIGRRSGFPFWWDQVDNRDAAAVRETSRYFDPVHFARRIKCPVLSGVALRDDLATPSSVLAAFNQITSPKRMILLPTAGHQDENGSQAAYHAVANGEWLPALVQGKSPMTAK